MINIENLPTPVVIQQIEYKTILEELKADHKSRYPDWDPLESDEQLMMLEAFAYREMYLRNEFNNFSNAFFLSTTSGTNLDNYAVFYGIQRLQGSNPYAQYEFNLSEVQKDQDITIPKGLVLTDATNKYEAILTEEVIIKAGEVSADGKVELQLYIDTTDIKTQTITTSLPYITSVRALGDFANGAITEDDESFKERILLSMTDKSTAGSEETYKSFTFKADTRIEDVAVKTAIRPLQEYVSLFVGKNESQILEALKQLFADMATVEVYYYSKNADNTMQTRIEEALNKDEVIPLTDVVQVKKAIEIPYEVEAELKILVNHETAVVLDKARNNLKEGLESLKKIGTYITLTEIIDFLKVDGVKEVVINNPTQNIMIADNEIGVFDEKSLDDLTYTIIE